MSAHTEHARIDRRGLLISADTRFAALNARAGGAIGAAIAVPQVAMLASLANRLRRPVNRSAIAAEGPQDILIEVEATPDDGGVALALSGWIERPAQNAGGHDNSTATRTAWHWQTDAVLRVTHVDAGRDAIGLDPEAAAGLPFTRLFALDEDIDGNLPMLTALVQAAGFTGQPATVRHSGQHVRLSATATRTDDGRLLGYSGLAEPVEVPAADTDGDAATTPGAFAAKLDRALRGPLVRIAAHADTISSRADGPIRRDYAAYAQDIGSAARHLMALVDDLVDLEAIERTDFATLAEPIDLADIARRAAGLLAVRADDGEVRIDRPDADERIPAIGEFRRVLQILVNLIGNAVRYTPPGGSVWIRTEVADGVASVTIADQGKGIAAEDQARIFERFERVDPGEPGGSGLGLYIARRLARAMGGEISVDSAPGQGARFTLTLPAGRDA